MSQTINLTVQETSPVTLTTEQARVIEAVSPTIEAERTTGGVELTITNYQEDPETVTIYDGQTGATGQTGPAGQDGVSPTITSETITGGHRLTITDAQGETTVDVMDGVDGQDGSNGSPGADGYSPTASVSKSGSTATITITDKNGTTTAQVSDGQSGEAVEETVTGTTPSIIAVANHRYVCGEVATLSFTPCATGMCEVMFTSGTTATVLTLPNTVKFANGFDPTSLDASTTYALNVLDGVWGVGASWT